MREVCKKVIIDKNHLNASERFAVIVERRRKMQAAHFSNARDVAENAAPQTENTMRVIGITGQTGAGKSTVCKALAKYGFYHIDADAVAKSLYEKGAPILKTLADTFGARILTANGELDKKALAAAAFSDPARTKQLNAIVHPAVTERIREILERERRLGTKTVLIDAIALFESGEDALCDCTVGVIAPEAVRLSRIMARDGLSRDEALLRMRAQHAETFYTQHCDEVLRNYPPYDLEAEIQRVFPL